MNDFDERHDAAFQEIEGSTLNAGLPRPQAQGQDDAQWQAIGAFQMTDTLRQLYRESILRHAADPVGHGAAIEATHALEGHNPQCGDRIVTRFRVVNGVIEAAAFDGEACSICLASASLLCEQVPGESVNDLLELKARLERALGEDSEEEIGAFSPLLGVRPYPSRVQCALLPWQTASRALRPGGQEPG
jgi:nitrogen fixation NifU-like protein